MQDPKDTVAALGAVVLAAACCLLPLLILGGLGVAGGIAWGRVGLIFAGAAVLVLVLVRAAAVALRRRKNWVMTRNKRVPRWGTDHGEDPFQDRSA